MSIKIDRLNSTFAREISYILQNEIKDPNIKFVTVTVDDWKDGAETGVYTGGL